MTETRAGELGDLLHSGRVLRGLSQADVASASGISVATMRRIEKGDVAHPSVFVILSLFTALRIDFGRLRLYVGPD